jgi:hypothetical protein
MIEPSEKALEFYEHIERVVAAIAMPPISEQNKQAFIGNLADLLTRYASAARLEEANAAIANVQEAIDIWKSWDTDDGYEAMNTSILIRERLKARAAQQKAPGEGT